MPPQFVAFCKVVAVLRVSKHDVGSRVEQLACCSINGKGAVGNRKSNSADFFTQSLPGNVSDARRRFRLPVHHKEFPAAPRTDSFHLAYSLRLQAAACLRERAQAGQRFLEHSQTK